MINELVEQLSLSDRFFYYVGAGDREKVEEIGWELFKKHMGQEYYSYASEVQRKANLPDEKVEPLIKPHLKDIILRNHDGRRKCFPELALPSKLSLEDKLSAGLELIKNKFGNIEEAKKLMQDFDLSYGDVAELVDSNFKSLVRNMIPSWDEYEDPNPYDLADFAVSLLQAFPYQPNKKDALIVFSYLLNKDAVKQEKAIAFMQRCDLTISDVKSFTMKSFFGDYSIIQDLLKTHINLKNSEGIGYLVKTFEISPEEFKEVSLQAVKSKLYKLDIKAAADISKEHGLTNENLKEPAIEVYRELILSGKYGSADIIADKYELKPEDTKQIIRDKCKDLINRGRLEELNEFRVRYEILDEEFSPLADTLCKENLRREYSLSISIEIAEKCGLDYLEDLQTIKSRIDFGRRGKK